MPLVKKSTYIFKNIQEGYLQQFIGIFKLIIHLASDLKDLCLPARVVH